MHCRRRQWHRWCRQRRRWHLCRCCRCCCPCWRRRCQIVIIVPADTVAATVAAVIGIVVLIGTHCCRLRQFFPCLCCLRQPHTDKKKGWITFFVFAFSFCFPLTFPFQTKTKHENKKQEKAKQQKNKIEQRNTKRKAKMKNALSSLVVFIGHRQQFFCEKS